MHHPNYNKPLQFCTAPSCIPPTPNLQQIKRTNMKLKTQKLVQHQRQIKIMTPRSTRNLHTDNEKKKSFRNLSLVVGDCESENIVNQTNERSLGGKELREKSQNSNSSANNHRFELNEGYEGKENVSVNQFNMNMKKKSKQNINIEFKQVKSTKNKRFSQEIQPKQPIDQKKITTKPNNTHSRQQVQKSSAPKLSQNPAYHSNGTKNTPYANEFYSSTYQNHYKASNLQLFNEQLNNFSTYVSQVESKLHSNFAQTQQHLSEAIRQINEQFSIISLKLTQLHQTAIKQTTQCLLKLKAQHKANLKQLNNILKSITRYQADISTHYQDIVKQLQFSCFQEIMAKYNTKLEYFNVQMGGMLERNLEEPYTLEIWKKVVRFVERVWGEGRRQQQSGMKGNERQSNLKGKGKREVLVVKEQLSSKRVS